LGIYLDYNASAPIDMRVVDSMVDTYKFLFGNADSRTHDFGDNARKAVDDARASVANLIGVKKDEVLFTSGATESDNLAIHGMKEYGFQNNRKHIIVSGIEHKAVLETAKSLENFGFEVEIINPDDSGRINDEEILKMIREDTLLVSVMHVNNETGIIQPVDKIGEALSGTNTFFHIDATQSCGKLVEEIRGLKYDMMSISAHKMSGPQGIGALILKRKRYKLPPISPTMYGGHQEQGLRPGTTPVALAVGFGKACDIALEEYVYDMMHCENAKKIILELLRKSELRYKINGSQEYCMPSTINISLEGVSSEALMLASKQYCGISNGSACTSKEYVLSYVLTAMGLSVERMEGALRISWGAKTDLDVLRVEFKNLLEVARNLSLTWN